MSQTLQTTPADVSNRWGVARGGYLSNAVMLWLGMRFLRLAYVFVWFAAIYFFVCVGKARRGSMAYLDLMHGPGKRGWLNRGWQTYRHMVEFGFLLLDRAVMLARPGHGFAISCDGLIHLADTAREASPLCIGGKGAIMLSAHFGNAEIAAPYMRHMGFHRPIHIVMYQDPRQGTEKFHTRHRRMLADVQIISTTDAIGAGAKIMGALKKGEVVAMRADRTLSGRDVSVQFMGREVYLPAGPFLAAALSGAPVVSIYTCRLGFRKYGCRISMVARYGEDQPGTRDERVARAAQEYATRLEEILRMYPYQWSNFYDFWRAQGPRESVEKERVA